MKTAGDSECRAIKARYCKIAGERVRSGDIALWADFDKRIVRSARGENDSGSFAGVFLTEPTKNNEPCRIQTQGRYLMKG